MRKKTLRRFLATILTLALSLQAFAGCAPADPAPETDTSNAESFEATTENAQSAFDAFTDQVFRDEIVRNTLNLHYMLKDPTAHGIRSYDISLGEATLESLQESFADSRALLETLHTFSYDQLTPDQQKVYDIFEDYLTTALEGEPYALYTEELSPTIGIQSQLPILLSEYAFYDTQDIEEYLQILSLVPGYYQQLLDFEKEKSTNGLFMSDRAVDDIVASCEAFLADPDHHYLLATFDERLEGVSGLTDARKEAYRERNRELFTMAIVPAYEQLITELTALKGTGKYDGGLCQYPDGKTYYEHLVRMSTGTGHSVEELKERIQTQINSQLLEMSFRFQNSNLDEEDLNTFAFSLTDPGAILEDLKSKISKDFPAIPDTTYQIKYVPATLESTLSPAFYLTPPLDDPTNNVIYINNSQLDDASLYSTLAHEGYPGHLYQSVYAASRTATPLLALLSCTGYSEGWATYVEYYAYGLDDGVNSRLTRIISLNSSITLGLYALADIGINYDGWTMEDTAAFLQQWFGVSDPAALEEFYYIMVEAPANYLNYYVGYLEILLLRDEAKDVLFNDFDLKAFHTFLLDMGDCSFRVIDKYFDAWLAAQQPETETSAADPGTEASTEN